MTNPATKVIEICGGVDAVVRATGRHRSNVLRWRYGRDKGGTGGLVPSEMQIVLLRFAKSEGIDLRPEHFFPDELVGEDAA